MKQQETQSNALQTANGRAESGIDQNELGSTPRSDSAERANKWAVLAIVAVGVFMATLDSSIVNISRPTIAHYFGVPLNGAVEWVTIAYLVAVAGTLLTIGRLADMIGRKPIWVIGLVIFTLGSAICGVASSLGMLIAARAFQGLGGALLMSISPVMLTSAFPARERGRALGLNPVVIALVALVVVERRVPDPIIDLELLHNRVFLSANVSLVLSFLALFAVSFMLPFYLEELRGFPTAEAGLLLTPLPLTIAVLAPFSGALADRIGTRWLAAGGLALACLGLLLISQLDAHSSVWDIVWRLIVIGAGQAMFQSPNNSALLGAVPRSRQGSASGFLATGRVVGQSLSVALAGAIFVGLGGAAAGGILGLQGNSQKLSVEQLSSLQQTFAHAFHITFITCAAIAFIGVFTSLVRGKENKSQST